MEFTESEFAKKGKNYHAILYPDRAEMYEADLITFYYNKYENN